MEEPETKRPSCFFPFLCTRNTKFQVRRNSWFDKKEKNCREGGLNLNDSMGVSVLEFWEREIQVNR